ncbi:hypothetical protein THASP1DRAFT_33504 [Thamnocephalis sphaerospora]|uniref:Tyrosinase copper-binding domain-containing protein n=1 Tax=Thamnocephalis sphaerospora TaxID=78915 RepID=A0A4P9XGF4_9FUNG|nr:hypothetical protein THASP1DRAFT_33504 [Thamnocephalis sphaerospora]|eukprot:RKP04697.1 hypothetical protein THASP1DRAFT_33504 [Thamnocephalis sphaerospora]
MIRTFDGFDHITPWWSWNDLNGGAFKLSSYEQFYDTIYIGYQKVLRGIGGQFGGSRSPDDPLFFVTHTFVDKLWADWQKLSEANANAYNGYNRDLSDAKKTDMLVYGYRVENVMNTRDLCYEYANHNGESNPTTTPPTTTPPTTDPPTTTSPTTTPPTTTPPTTTPTDSYSTTSTSSYPLSSPSTPTYPPTTTGGSLPTTIGVPPYIHGNIPKNDTYVNTTVPGTGTKPADNMTTYVPGHSNGKVYPPAPLPETWCRANNMPVELVRAVEAAAYKDIEQLNRHSGYIPKPDLVSRVDALKQYAKQDEKLINYVGSKVTDIKYDSNNPAVVASVRTKVVTVLEQVYKQVNIVYPKAAENTYGSVNVYSGGKPAKRCRRGGLRRKVQQVVY